MKVYHHPKGVHSHKSFDGSHWIVFSQAHGIKKYPVKDRTKRSAVASYLNYFGLQ